MFNRAYVRGVQNAMVQAGHAAFPDEVSAAKVADYIADRIELDPTKGPISREVTAAVAEHIIDASKWHTKQANFVPGAFYKVASVDDLGKLAHAHALDVMQKAAEGSTIEGGDKGNVQPNSAEGKMDIANRPLGYAEDSRGKTEVDTKPGAVGKEQEQPAKPAESPPGSNSVIEQSRTASLASLISKMASGTGSTIMGGDKGNKEMSSAEAIMDQHQRPMGYAKLPGQGDLGELMKHVSGPAVIGKEMPHPKMPGEHPAGSNSVIEHSAKAAAEDPYMSLFKKVAAEIMEYIPASTNEDAKVAHVRACMGMTQPEKAHYLVGLQKEAADATSHAAPGTASYGMEHNAEKTHARQGAYDGRKANQGGHKVAEMPDFIKEKIEAKAEGKSEEKSEAKGDEKHESKAEEKKEHEEKDEKSASLLEHIRRISNTVRA